MLKINREFRRGILFVRLKGSLTKNTSKQLYNEITLLLREMKIYNVVFNLSKLNEIDLTGVRALLYNYNLCRRNHGISMLCGANGYVEEYTNNTSMFQIKDEISAINMIKI